MADQEEEILNIELICFSHEKTFKNFSQEMYL